MNNICLLDCTLRDGGYVNNWEFGLSNMLCVFERLVQSGVEFIEVGFLDDRESFNPNRSIQPNTKCYDKIYSAIDKKDTFVFGMIDYGTCSINNIELCRDSFLDGIRIIFKKTNMRGAIKFAQLVKNKGYMVSLNLVSITSYDDKDLIELIELVNNLNPDIVSMVDTYGLMHQEDMLHYFYLLNHNLNREIKLGYHSHNNFQLGYANEITMIKKSANRDVVVDGTVYGMGKSAGNAPLELLAMYLNENYEKNYNLNQILELIDILILRIYKEHYWGYSLLYFLAASNDCHPNYIQFLLDKNTLAVAAINDIAKSITREKKLNYDEKYITKLYTEYQRQIVSSPVKEVELFEKLKDIEILLLGPGASIRKDSDMIRDYIEEHSPNIISVNCIPLDYPVDYVFIGNAKRYDMLLSSFPKIKSTCKVIATSNITPIDRSFDFVFQYDKLKSKDPMICDNTFVMILNLLSQLGITEVTVAGFDGFSKEADHNYYNDSMIFVADYGKLEAINDTVKIEVNKIRKKMGIRFITKSTYE